MSLSARLSFYQPQALAALRIMTALQFIEHGTQKFFNFPPAAEPFGDLTNLIGVAGLLEIVGGGLVLVGLFTRPAAFVLCGFMAVAYFMAHMPVDFWPVNNRGDAAISFCFIFLYLVFAGPGAFALDNRRS
ncbi:DoxX family protein [Rhizobium sp. TRM96647]|uniref:DoxX family protein n=1 Tax=unclassified Rhizobium TaxID=2613769 RepID=UPI0021E85FE6|nr:MULTISPECIES: DoxX family protein [unclassified Rhizobium]MCV3737477.1 DoxX family protein [Rhizobium sp. TRM96647]MCV3756433.1 DoxX family protein [Rhizobium sp. TRM96650]